MKKIFLPVLAVLVISGVFYACKKSDAPANNNLLTQKALSVYLSDAAVAFDAVNIDLVGVEAKVDTSTHMFDDHFADGDKPQRNDSLGDMHGAIPPQMRPGGKGPKGDSDQFGVWTALNFNAGVYNVAALKNGLDTLLATSTITGTVRKLRLTLGSNNTIVVGGVTYPLQLVTDSINLGKYLYLDIHKQHRDTTNSTVKIWIDFDLSRSIIQNNGGYYLIPKLKPYCDKNFAEVVGKVLPAEANPLVKVYNTTDTATTYPNKDGYFKIRGLSAGTYTVLYVASNGYKDAKVENVAVTTTAETKLADVTLTK